MKEQKYKSKELNEKAFSDEIKSNKYELLNNDSINSITEKNERNQERDLNTIFQETQTNIVINNKESNNFILEQDKNLDELQIE